MLKLSREEWDAHRELTMAPISLETERMILDRVRRLKPGDFFWVQAEGIDLPVKFEKLIKAGKVSILLYQYILDGQPWCESGYYYTFIRKLTKREKALLIRQLDSTKNFYTR